MHNTVEVTGRAGGRTPRRILFEPALAWVAGTSAAVMFALFATLNWPESLAVVVGGGALAGGAVFAIIELRWLGKAGQ